MAIRSKGKQHNFQTRGKRGRSGAKLTHRRKERRAANSGPDLVCWEHQANREPIRLSFSIKVF